MEVSQLVQYTITGLSTGSIYALVAIGFVIIYSVTGILNFAQGEFSMLGALVTISLVKYGIPIILSIPLAIVFVAGIGLLIERVTIYPSRDRLVLTLIILTIGLSALFRGLALIIWGTNPHSLTLLPNIAPIQLFGAVLLPQAVFILIVLGILLLILYWFFERSYRGLALRASEVNPQAANLMGINTFSMSALAFTLSAAVGALAGIMAAPMSEASYDMGFYIGLKGFIAMVIGGMNNIPGAVVGGLVLGLLEAFTGGLLSTTYSQAVSFIVLLLVLFVKPGGLWTRASGTRV